MPPTRRATDFLRTVCGLLHRVPARGRSTNTGGRSRRGVAVGLTLACTLLVPAAGSAQTGGLTLERAIELALDQSGRAGAARAALTAAEHRGAAFSARLLPRLSLQGTVPSYNRSIIEVLQPDGSTLFRSQNLTNAMMTATLSQPLPFTGGNVFVSSSLARLSLSGTQDDLSWQSTPVLVGITQPLFRPNVLGWDKKEQVYVDESARREFLEAREDIALETTALFFAAYAAESSLANAVANVAVNDTLYLLNTGRFDIGSIGENDLLQSELALLRARTNVDAATLARERSHAQLRIALGLAPDAPIEIVIPEGTPDVDADTAVAVAEALKNRSVSTQLALQDVRAERGVVEARQNTGFGATLQASYGFNATAPDMSAAYQDLLEARRFSVFLEVPVWQWGAGSQTVKAAEAEREGSRQTAQLTREQTALDARFAVLDLTQARRNLALSATADTVAARRFEVAYNRYVIGNVPVDNLYIAQAEKDQARESYVQALGRYWEAYYRLRRVTLYDFEQGIAIR